MLLENDRIDITEFLKITASGVRFASFTEIRDGLIIRYKEIYGQDIDVSTGSADGVFINNLALLINNILQTMKAMYGNLDVNTASGSYLDTLCRLSNIIRKGATRSIANVTITNTSTSLSYNAKNLVLIDKAGITWRIKSDIIISPSSSVSVAVFCDEEGPIEAPSQWINRVAQIDEESIYLAVSQPDPAIIGEIQESDSSLRARRSRSIGAQGTTVLESLTGQLLSLTGVKDVKIIENKSSSSSTADDSTSLASHSIYVVLRLVDGITVDESIIGEIIYQKLTPGILTNEFTPETTYPSGVSKTYDAEGSYPSEVSQVGGNFDVYWKEAIPITGNADYNISSTIVITDNFNKGSVNDSSSSEQDVSGDFAVLCKGLAQYLNELPLGSKLVYNDVLVALLQSTPLFKESPTCAITNITCTKFNAVNPITYYNYNTFKVVKGTGTNTYTIKLSSTSN